MQVRNAEWIWGYFPTLKSVPPSVVNKWILNAESKVGWAKECNMFDTAVLYMTAYLLTAQGYPNSQDNVGKEVRKFAVGDVSTEYATGQGNQPKNPLLDFLDALRKKCKPVGLVTNSHILARRGIPHRIH